MRSFMLVAFAAVAALVPSSAFVATTASPRAVAAVAGRHYSTPLAAARAAPPAAARAARANAAAPLRMMSGAETAVEQKGLVTVYHKDNCPYCAKVFALLEGDLKLSVTRVNVLKGEDSEKKIKQMKTFSGGANTLPQVFFNSEHLGGNDDVQKLHEEGKLEPLVAKVRAEAPGMMKATWYHPWY